MEVVRIIDGDTVEAIDPQKTLHRIRLAGIDAPESRQPFGERSRQHLASLVFQKPVRVEWKKHDQYGRLVATLALQPSELDVNLDQIRSGMAWHYKEYQQEQAPAQRLSYGDAELSAREQRIGLWVDGNPVSPQEWRRPTKDTAIQRVDRSNICHAPDSPSYRSIKHSRPYASMEDCVADGGRLPDTQR
jgi:endonuclease YncB( thermonuclease family)